MGLKKHWFLLQLCCIAAVVNAQTGVQEADLKGAFIYNFTKYIDWNQYDDGDTFIIGVIGSSSVVRSLKEIAETNTVNSKKIEIRFFDNPGEIEFCNILFIPENIHFPLSLILSKINKGMLTISEERGFASEGTAFNFVRKNGKLKFEVNLKSLSKADIKASSQLLKLAIIVN
jgi:hypothetical protein